MRWGLHGICASVSALLAFLGVCNVAPEWVPLAPWRATAGEYAATVRPPAIKAGESIEAMKARLHEIRLDRKELAEEWNRTVERLEQAR